MKYIENIKIGDRIVKFVNKMSKEFIEKLRDITINCNGNIVVVKGEE